MASAYDVLHKVLGERLRTLGQPNHRKKKHLSTDDTVVTISYFGSAKGQWEERPPHDDEPWSSAWGEETGDLFINEDVYFKNVPKGVWEYRLGGYPVLKKWLGYRDQKRRGDVPLSPDERKHFQSMIRRIAAVLILHERLDHAYEKAIEDCFTAEDLGLRERVGGNEATESEPEKLTEDTPHLN